MSAETLRRAAALMREEHGPGHKRHEMWSAMADWLDDVAGYSALIESGDYWNTNTAWLSAERHALTTARAYLGAPR